MKSPRKLFALTASLVCLGLVALAPTANADTSSTTTFSAWTERTPPADTSDSAWASIAYGNDTFVAIAGSGTKQVMTSPDGITWTARDAAEAKRWTAVTFGGGLFVAVRAAAVGDTTKLVMTSPDGITWTSRSITARFPFNGTSIAYGGGTFVAVGNNNFLTSTDGITWTERTIPQQSLWNAITYGGGKFVVVGQQGTARVMTSTNGIDWTVGSVTSGSWKSVTYGGEKFVAVAQTATSDGNNVMTSTNGTDWTMMSVGSSDSAQLVSVTFGNGLYVTAAGQSLGKAIFTSTDGATWTARTAIGDATNIWWSSVVYGKDKFVAVTSGSANGASLRIMTSADPSASAPTTTTTTTVAAKTGTPAMTGTATAPSAKPLTIPRAFGPNARRIAKRLGVPVPDGAKVRMIVSRESKRICRISVVGNLLSLKKGTCSIFLTVTPLEGKPLIIRQSFQVG